MSQPQYPQGPYQGQMPQGQMPQQQGQYMPPPGQQQMHAQPAGPQKKGFLKSLFDLSFSSFVTTRILKVLFVLGIIGCVLLVIGQVIGGIMTMVTGGDLVSVLVGLVSIALTPITFLLSVIFVRMYTELIIVMFRIAEHLAEINAKTK